MRDGVIVHVMNRELILVGGIEWNLKDFGKSPLVVVNVFVMELHGPQNGRFRSIPINFPYIMK